MTRSESGKKGYIASLEHHKAQYEKRQKDYKNKPSVCIECNNPLEYSRRKNKFCSHSCSAARTNRNRARINNCLNCKKLCSSSSIYCSALCHKELMRKEKDKVVNITKDLNSSYKAPASAKKFLLRTTKHICSICRKTKWNRLPIPLVMDHIDGNSDNWNLANLRLICGNCDMQTPTYKAKNKGKGRFSRRKRYAEGKSF